jgi:NitT/TauT family transport system substrate-binding protein
MRKFGMIGGVVLGLSLSWPMAALAQAPKANGETLRIQNYAGTTGNLHAVIAKSKGFCEKYNFKCELNTINSSVLGLQALIGKTIDVSMGGSDVAAAAVASGGDIVIVGVALANNVMAVSVRSDVPLPNRAKGYPAIMQDFKGLKIGVTARGVPPEWYFNTMLADAGLKPTDVTYVAVGGPGTTYTSMVIGKQIDAAIMFQPLTQLCKFNKTCETVVDLTIGEGSPAIKALNGAAVALVMRREHADSNPALVASFHAAMKDAAAWFNDPANFDELVKIYTPLISFGDLPGADQLRQDWIKSVLSAYSKDLAVNRQAVQASIDYYKANGTIEKPIEAAKVVWDKAP